MRITDKIAQLFKAWPVVVVLAGVALTFVWGGALIWALVALISGFTGS